MAVSNHDRLGKGLELLRDGLLPFVKREIVSVYGQPGWDAADAERIGRNQAWDAQLLLSTMWNQWNDVFRNTLGNAERSLVSELRDWRNKWAHQNAVGADDAYRALDSIERLLSAISAEEAREVQRLRTDLNRIRVEEELRKEGRKSALAAVDGQPAAGLKPWRDVVTPHPDVASGQYQQAEFAANLDQVYRGEGSAEYGDPSEFFRRTYLTEGLRLLLTGALKRLSGGGGNPVVELQTNFGGGKTHSMLALYHLFGGTPAGNLTGIEPLLKECGLEKAPNALRSVIVGTALNPAKEHTLPDGAVVRTIWGLMAHQLLGKEGCAIVAEADKAGVSPGSDALRELFTRASPCLILIDEWVAYVRQLYGNSDLPAGSFDANLTFAQALTEAAKAAPATLVVASIPSSDIEVGGTAGAAALERLRNTFSRLESAWRPASTEEGFEIVRRRLFQPISTAEDLSARDAVVSSFGQLYRSNALDFPSDCREAAYERRMSAAYPIHPELFDRLYQDWSSLDRFQRTRGVLRLMAAVIHALWEGQDSSLLIMPGTVPIAASSVQFELTQYLDDPWTPVIERDVDGPAALPLQIDRANPNLSRYAACRRVARTIYIGSAPTLRTSHRGLEDRQIKLGSIQPGENVPIFGDALRRLADQATHLYEHERRYWFDTQPSVARLARDRAQQYTEDDVFDEIRLRLRAEAQRRGDFAAVYAAPASPAEVPDEAETRIVVLGPESPFARSSQDSAARQAAQLILEKRATGDRLWRNTLVFVAPDSQRLPELEQEVRQYRAWKSIESEHESLELTPFQKNQAVTRRKRSDEIVTQRLAETYQWLLVPEQPDPKGVMSWLDVRIAGTDPIAVRAARKLRADALLVSDYAGNPLRREMDKIPLWPADPQHISVKQLADYFAQYLYLSRLRNRTVLVDAVQDGVGLTTWTTDSFAYADGYDEDKKRYLGLRCGQLMLVRPSESGLVVHPEAAQKQLDADAADAPPKAPETQLRPSPTRFATLSPTQPTDSPVATDARPRRFHGSIRLEPNRVARDAGRVAEEVIQHLAGLLGASSRVTLEIDIEIEDGVPENIQRIVTENCRTLKFDNAEFENE